MAGKRSARKSGSASKPRKSKVAKAVRKKAAAPARRKAAVRPARKAAPARAPAGRAPAVKPAAAGAAPARKAPGKSMPAKAGPAKKAAAVAVKRAPSARGAGAKAPVHEGERQATFEFEMEPPVSELSNGNHLPPAPHPPKRRGKASVSDADYPGDSLTVGMEAPDFTLPSTEGRPITLSEFRGRRVVLYFYPKDDTPGCTMEACAFRDSMSRIEQKGAVVLGVSLDDELSHERFRMKYNLNFPLLSDKEAAVSRKYGTYKEKSLYGRSFWGIERTTFVLDRDGKVEHVFRRVKVEGHAEEVMATLAG